MVDLTKCDWCRAIVAKKAAFDYSLYNRKLEVDEDSADLCSNCMRKLRRFTKAQHHAKS